MKTMPLQSEARVYPRLSLGMRCEEKACANDYDAQRYQTG
jgi:hypothetical protein